MVEVKFYIHFFEKSVSLQKYRTSIRGVILNPKEPQNKQTNQI